MGNHGGGIPKGAKNRAGTKGTSAGSADKGSNKFSVGDHVRVHAGVHTGIEGKVRRTLGVNHVHVVPKSGRSFIAHVRNVGTVHTKHFHAGVG
jgi:hypothetical protein